MARNSPILIFTALAAGLFTAVAALAPQSSQAQRKSIRWATSGMDTYGYKVANSMVKVVEEALGREYAPTQRPSAPCAR